MKMADDLQALEACGEFHLSHVWVLAVAYHPGSPFKVKALIPTAAGSVGCSQLSVSLEFPPRDCLQRFVVGGTHPVTGLCQSTKAHHLYLNSRYVLQTVPTLVCVANMCKDAKSNQPEKEVKRPNEPYIFIFG